MLRQMATALTICVCALTSLMTAAPTEDLYLTNATLVDPAARQLQRGNLLIRNGRIEVAPPKAPAGFTGRTLDLTGKWVIPGLIDLHTHTYGNVDSSGTPIDRPNPPGVAVRMLYAGVTAFLDLFGAEEEQFTTRAQQRAGALDGADMFSSLSCITATGAHGTEYGLKPRIADSPEEAIRQIESLKSRQPDVIKIIYERGAGKRSIDHETLVAAVSAARRNDIKTIVHVASWQDARDAVEAGASAVTHTPAGLIPADLARLMVARKVASIPTLTLHTDALQFVFDRTVLESPLARALTTSAVISSYRSSEIVSQAAAVREENDERKTVTFKSVKAMADAGVRILVGTDSGSIGTLQGYSVHRELRKLVGAGLSPWQALNAATTDAAAFLGRTYGVRPGSEATLVVLDASPIEDVRNTQRIAYVVHHGAVVDRARLIASKVAGLSN